MSVQVNDTDKLKFAVVPFSAFVNVGPGYGPSFDKKGKQIAGTGAPWLDLHGVSNVPQSELGPGASRFQLYNNVGQTWPGCVETRYAAGKDYDVDDTPADPARRRRCSFRRSASTSPIRRNSSTATSPPTPSRTTSPPRRRRSAGTKYGVKTDGSGIPLLGGLLEFGCRGLLGRWA